MLSLVYANVQVDLLAVVGSFLMRMHVNASKTSVLLALQTCNNTTPLNAGVFAFRHQLAVVEPLLMRILVNASKTQLVLVLVSKTCNVTTPLCASVSALHHQHAVAEQLLMRILVNA